MNKKCYISGAIQKIGIDEASKLFEEAELDILSLGLTPVNPMKLPHMHNKSDHEYMKEDIAELLTCGFIFMLPNYIISFNAITEKRVAESIGLTRVFKLTSGEIVKTEIYKT